MALQAIKAALVNGLRAFENIWSTNHSLHVFASVKTWEAVDISSVDHDVTLNDGLAMAIYCEVAGEVLKMDTTEATGQTTPALQAGFNPWECTKVYKTGSTLAGNVYVVSW